MDRVDRARTGGVNAINKKQILRLRSAPLRMTAAKVEHPDSWGIGWLVWVRCIPGPRIRTWGTHDYGGIYSVAVVQISRITGMIIGLRPVVFWIRRFNSPRTFSLTMP